MAVGVDIHLAGVAHLVTHIVTSYSVAGVAGVALMALGLALVVRLVPVRCGAVDAAAVGVAGVALGDIHLRFTWQAWHLAQLDMDNFYLAWQAWQAWHLWHWAGSGGALGFRCGAGTPRLFGVAGVALGDIHLRFTWQAWYLVTSTGHVPLLHHLHFCVHCDMFVLDEIVVPASSVAI